MPEVTIHEDNDPSLAENDIWLAGQFLDMFSEPQAFPVKGGAHSHLWACILSLDAGHAVAALLGCQVIRHHPILDIS